MRTINPELAQESAEERANPEPFRSKDRSPLWPDTMLLGYCRSANRRRAANLASRMGVSYKGCLLRFIPVPKMMLIVEHTRT
jgi:hypothetical protein